MMHGRSGKVTAASGELRAASCERPAPQAPHRRGTWWLHIALLLAVLVLLPAATGAQQLLAPARIDSLPPAERAAWRAYRARSDSLRAADRAFMDAELRAAGLERMRKATYARGFEITSRMDQAYFRSDSAAAFGRSLVTWQTPAGGWAKRTDFSRPRQPGESWYGESDSWHYIGTIDNNATNAQLQYLARLAAAHPDPAFRESYLRGIEYLVTAQFPNGCWPQVYPLQGGYSDAATFNDNAMINTLETLEEAASGDVAFVPAPLRRRAAAAVARGLECILASQAVVNGRRTVWGQQHDPLTLAVTHARSYELAGLSGKESAAIMTWLMTLPSPDARTVAAIEATAEYFRRTAIHGYEYGEDQVLRAKPGAGPIWARLTELGTDRPIFANRDGVRLYDWNQLTDRRSGYAWFGTEPGSALQKYEKWVRARAKAGAPARIPVQKP